MHRIFFAVGSVAASLVLTTDAQAQPQLTVNDITPTTTVSLPQGGQRIRMQTLALTASCDRTISVKGIAIHHHGPGDTRDIAGVYIMRETERLSKSVTFAIPDRIVTIPVSSLTLKPCSTSIIDVAIDIAASASVGGGHAIGIADDGDIDAGTAKVIWNPRLPVPASDTTASSPRGIDAGYPLMPEGSTLFGKQRLLLRLQLKSDASRRQLLHAITLTNEGKARDADVRNLFITTGNGVRVTKIEPKLRSNWVRLVFDPPLLMERSAATLLILRGDIVSSRRRTVHFILEEPSDVEITATR